MIDRFEQELAELNQKQQELKGKVIYHRFSGLHSFIHRCSAPSHLICIYLLDRFPMDEYYIFSLKP